MFTLYNSIMYLILYLITWHFLSILRCCGEEFSILGQLVFLEYLVVSSVYKLCYN